MPDRGVTLKSMTRHAPSAQRLLTYPLIYLGEAGLLPVQLAQGTLHNLSGLPILIRAVR